MIKDYISQVKKVSKSRVTSISHSVGVNEAYRYYKKTSGKLDSKNFRKAIKLINTYVQELIAEGNDFTLPQTMGELQLRKFKTSIDFKNGKLKTNLPVDWKRTLELWAIDKEAENNKTLVRTETPFIYRLYYKKQQATYNNKVFIEFSTNRTLRLKLKDNIMNHKLDAFLVN